MRTRDRRCPLRLRSTTIEYRETFDRPCAEHVCYCRVPSGATVRPVGGGCSGGAAVTVYTARGPCAAAFYPTPRLQTRSNRWSRRGGGRRPVVTTATASSSRTSRSFFSAHRRRRIGTLLSNTRFYTGAGAVQKPPDAVVSMQSFKTRGMFTITPSGSPPASTNPVRCSRACIPNILQPSTDAR